MQQRMHGSADYVFHRLSERLVSAAKDLTLAGEIDDRDGIATGGREGH
jgi:hypothetical protein